MATRGSKVRGARDCRRRPRPRGALDGVRSDASRGAIVRAGTVGRVDRRRRGVGQRGAEPGKGTMGAAAASGCVAALAALSSSLERRRCPARSSATASSRRGASPVVYTECVARFGAVAKPSLPSAVLTVRERVGRALETAGFPPASRPRSRSSGRRSRRGRRDRRPRRSIERRRLPGPARGRRHRRDPTAWSSRRGWSVPVNEVPSGAFVALSSDASDADLIGLVLSPGSSGTSVAHVNGGAWLGVHRQAVNDDGHGLGAARQALVRRPRARSRFSSRGFGGESRRLAAESSRPPTAAALGGDVACELAEWSPVAEPLPRHVEVLAVTERRRGMEDRGGRGGGPRPVLSLWFRVRGGGRRRRRGRTARRRDDDGVAGAIARVDGEDRHAARVAASG